MLDHFSFSPPIISFLFLSSSFSSSLFSCFTHTVHTRAHSGIPHRRNNYYYESDPGQETTIAFSFLLLLPSLPSLVPRGPHAEFVRLVLFSPRVSSYPQSAELSIGTLSGLSNDRPPLCDNYSESG